MNYLCGVLIIKLQSLMKNKIKEVLKELGMSQKQLCELVGMSEAGMSNAINGSASKETISKIADALGMQESELVDDEMLYAKYSADKTPLKLGSIELPCYVLSNGMRVFSGRGIQRAVGAGSNASGQWLQRFVNSDAIRWNMLAGSLEKFNSPIEFRRNSSSGSQSITYGYDATLLIDLCTAIIDAYNGREWNVDEVHFKAANVILKAVAKVGIIALVDEATGYDKEKTRAKDELQKFLSTFINQEACKWIKTFDDTFFEDIYRMRNWTWEKTTNRPSFVGKIINDIVYERIAPLVYNELKNLNPKNDAGNRKHKFHQFLTSEVGRPALKQHLAIIHSFAMAAGYDWGRFMYLLDKSHPKQYQQLALFDEFDFE
jgi:DNA-binding XRE family transcriptional regulator